MTVCGCAQCSFSVMGPSCIGVNMFKPPSPEHARGMPAYEQACQCTISIVCWLRIAGTVPPGGAPQTPRILRTAVLLAEAPAHR